MGTKDAHDTIEGPCACGSSPDWRDLATDAYTGWLESDDILTPMKAIAKAILESPPRSVGRSRPSISANASSPDLARWAALQGEQIAHLLDEAREETRRETIEACARAVEKGVVHPGGALMTPVERIRAMQRVKP